MTHDFPLIGMYSHKIDLTQLTQRWMCIKLALKQHILLSMVLTEVNAVCNFLMVTVSLVKDSQYIKRAR